MKEIIKNSYNFVAFEEVCNGNPNGDPDASGMPRIDPETGLGLISDVCIKRKVRNYIEAVKGGEPGYKIYIKDNVPLNRSDAEAGDSLSVGDELRGIQNSSKDEAKKIGSKLKKNDPNIDVKLRDYMCKNFFDVRAFGAVMTTFTKGALNCGQVTGPVQIKIANSIDPIATQEITITRVAITTEKDAENKETEIGRKYIVPYALYRIEGFITPNFAKTTGFSEEDLDLLWDAIMNMCEIDRSSSRGKTSIRKLVIFKHDSAFGNAPAHKLFDLVKAKKREEVAVPRSYEDYSISVDLDNLPNGVHCEIRE